MKLLSRNGDELTYEASFWDGWSGKRFYRVCRDRIVPRYRTKFVDGEWRREKIGERLANTARNVSYYSALEKALGIKWGADR